MDRIIKQERTWYHIKHERPQFKVLVDLGGINCNHIGELVKRKGKLFWKDGIRGKLLELSKYLYWSFRSHRLEKASVGNSL